MHILIILFGIVCIIVALYLILYTNDKDSNIYNDNTCCITDIDNSYNMENIF